MNHARKLLPLLLLAAAACAPRPAPRPPAPPPPPAAPPFPHATVWTRGEGTPVRVDSARTAAIPRLFTRLEVLGSDSAALRVRCVVCAPQVEGWVEKRSVVYETLAPDAAAQGELAGFLLAVRAAAARHDVAALRPVLSRSFTSSLEPTGEGIIETLHRWEQERYRSLDRLPALLDAGVASRDGRIWAAPQAYLATPGYPGLRAGFRRGGTRWEWVFLVGA